MARKRTRAPLSAVIQSAIETIIGARDRLDRELKAWEADVDRRPRTDHSAGIEGLYAEARRATDVAGASVDAAIAAIGKEHGRQRRTTWDATEVESAWRRVHELLDSGLGIADVIDSPVFDRLTAEAIRRNFPAWLLGTTKNTKLAAETAERVADDVLQAELAHLEGAELAATTAELGARAGRRAVEGLARFLSSDRGAQAQIRLGHDLSDAGYVSPAPIEQPLAEAERQRNSLSPELRDALDGNARAVGWQAEPSLTLGGR
jgi:hypothetical protein